MNDEKRKIKYGEELSESTEKTSHRTKKLQGIFNRCCNLFKSEKNRLKLMYLTSDPIAAIEAENAGVDRIFLDLEILGKEERQGHLDTVVSRSSLDDVSKIRKAIKKSEFLVRCNPVHPGIAEEIDRIINDGADIIMLPFFKTSEEVETFLSAVDGRVKTVLLFETKESVENVDDILALNGIDEVYIGLNDLHLSLNMTFMFELLADGTVEMLCEKFSRKGIPYGFGGIAKIGEGLVKSEVIIGEHKRLGSTSVILSRTFRNEVGNSRPVKDLSNEIAYLRKREEELENWSDAQFEENRLVAVNEIEKVTEAIRKKAAAKVN